MKQTRWITAGLPLTAVGLVLTLFACSGDIPSSPIDAGPPSQAIQDALNGEGGNPFVFLKPPVVDQPDPALFGTFNPNLEPVVEICVLDAVTRLCTGLLHTNDGTNPVPARYTVDGGPGGEAIRVDTTVEEYQVQIHFSLFDLSGEEEYRIITRIGSRVLAFADILMVSPKEMKSADSENNIVFTNDKKTVPWKVRIDNGALCWDPDEAVVSCTSSTVTATEQETITLTSSDGEEVDFHLPAGWTATVNGDPVTELTISIREVPAVHGTEGDPSCFAAFVLGDPDTGQPSNCYDVQADTDTEVDVVVLFGATAPPILAFCPDADVLQAIADGDEGYIMTSVEEDAAGATRRTYRNVNPATDFGGCSQIGFGDGTIGRFAAQLWRGVRPVLRPLLPTPLYVADLGFGGEVTRLGTIFFWARTPDAIEITPADPSVEIDATVQLAVEPVYHHAGSGGTAAGTIEWSAAPADALVATVDPNGVVTGIASGTATITATAPGVLDPDGQALTATALVTVTATTVAIFDNGVSSGPQTRTANDLSQRLFEDFTLTETTVITAIQWQQHDDLSVPYTGTEVLIFSDLPMTVDPVYSADIVASRTPNDTGTIFEVFEGFDYEITDLSVTLPPGTYWIGLNTIGGRTGWDDTTGGDNTIPGYFLINANFPEGSERVGNLAFRLLGHTPNQ